MEEMHRTTYVGKGFKLPCPLPVHHFFQISMCSPTWKFSEPHPFGFLWRIHYTGMVD